jgi:hypothetical protein
METNAAMVAVAVVVLSELAQRRVSPGPSRPPLPI